MTMEFQPLLPLPLLAGLVALAILLAGYGLFRRQRGMVLRALALGLMGLALFNPLLLEEDRQALPTVVAIAADRSQSQDSGDRKQLTDATVAALKESLANYRGIEVRVIDTGRDDQTDTPSTRIFSGLNSALEDVPASRIGGVIVITDGQVHDIPSDNRMSGSDAPIHTLLTGKQDEFDRRIEIIRAPRFGIVNKEQELVYKVIDDGDTNAGTAAIVTLRMNGEIYGRIPTVPGEEKHVKLAVPRGGDNIIELSVDPIEGEVTALNNRIIHLIEGIRENLRVLLVSGEPHAGERAWRNLLKSDASVDLVHFTILRPPEKQDGTPINELSLIAFPTRELFVDKIKDFDLIIFDRYQHRGVLPILYYDNIAQYVKEGGALLLVTGPEHAGHDSIAETPLASVLPAAPLGDMIEQAFYPRLSELGKKHPVTRDLNGSGSEPPKWGRWFRAVDVSVTEGNTLMTAAGDKPLLVLNRAGDGRVAMLLSDQGWLWARGLEGGGPHVDLYRRIAHWLMKEPGLEEEALTARAVGRQIEVTRQTIGDAPAPANVKSPSGRLSNLALKMEEPGLYRGRFDAGETGLFEITDGPLSTLVHSGAIDAPEFRETISTANKMQAVADNTGGIVKRLSADGKSVNLPQILTMRGQIRATDTDRMLIRMTSDTVLKGISSWPLFAGLLGLALLLLAVASTWWREGR